MSEISRTYMAPRRAGGPRRRVRRPSPMRRRGGMVTTLLVLLLVGGAAWIFWGTRDSHSMAELIPAGQKYEAFFGRFLSKRHHIADSAIWSLTPADSRLAEAPTLLRNNFGLPEWALNHIVYGPCHVSGRNVNNFSDVLLVTKMSRIGCLAEKFHRFLGVSQDPAGGLALRYLPHADVYYAVRGRVLVVSPARDTVIRAVTLRADDALAQEALDRGLGEAGTADIYGRFALTEEDPLGDAFQEVRVLCHFEEQSLTTAMNVRLATPWRGRLSRLLANTEPAALGTPPAGMLQLSANFGKSFGEVCLSLARIFDPSGRFEEVWASWKALDYDAAPGVGPLLAHVAGPAGPGWQISWRGIDENEMLPVPLLAATLDLPAQQAQERFEAFPPLPEGAWPWEAYPRYDAEDDRAYVPMIGGPSIEPSATNQGDTLFLCSSRTTLDNLRQTGAPADTLAEPGNLYLRLVPKPAMEPIVAAGAQLAENGFLRGYDRAEFLADAEQWLSLGGKMREITALAGHQNGDIACTLRIIMTDITDEQGDAQAANPAK
ncbi:MAG: hypothetical protein ACLFTT_04370 [Candidatus Hydrogenedentota bacterium]